MSGLTLTCGSAPILIDEKMAWAYNLEAYGCMVARGWVHLGYSFMCTGAMDWDNTCPSH